MEVPRALIVSLAVLLSLTVAGCSSKDADGAGPSQTSPPAASSSPSAASSSAPSAPAANASANPPQVDLSVSVEGLYPANPTLQPAELTVQSGAIVTLTYTNNDLNPLGSHDWLLEKVGARTDEIGQGESTTLTFTAPAPGDYAYYCAVMGHRERGMEGVLHVQ